MIPDLAPNEGGETVDTRKPYSSRRRINFNNDWRIGAAIQLDGPIAHALVFVHEQQQLLQNKISGPTIVPILEWFSELVDIKKIIVAVAAKQLHSTVQGVPFADRRREMDSKSLFALSKRFCGRFREARRLGQQAYRVSVILEMSVHAKECSHHMLGHFLRSRLLSRPSCTPSHRPVKTVALAGRPRQGRAEVHSSAQARHFSGKRLHHRASLVPV